MKHPLNQLPQFHIFQEFLGYLATAFNFEVAESCMTREND
jgi:hypothetical protein